ncbi:MAG: antitoxin YezG family protein [Oscillospiraceae bacterium]|nr:antitoxin YezG family protein [Oscillospiraceae bacterium]
MNEKIDNLQLEIATKFDELIPVEYKEAHLLFVGGLNVASTMYFCFIDAATGKVFPSDLLPRRKELDIDIDENEYRRRFMRLTRDIMNLQGEYAAAYDKEWYVMTCKLDQDGKFDISFTYEKPTGTFKKMVEKWCMDNFGITTPVVTVDMLKK